MASEPNQMPPRPGVIDGQSRVKQPPAARYFFAT
ncbi:MAG: hypothetical protein QOF84_5344 [Streptomyces sp.]|jgi:hypothetical protein|nr:hypothetical protein [Streptomyces sp.]